MGLDEAQFVAADRISSILRCPICTEIFDDPVFASGFPCHCTFCRTCITKWLATHKTCPNDRKEMKLHLLVPDRKIGNLVSEQLVYCEMRSEGCFWTGRWDARTAHESICPVLTVKELAADVMEKDGLIAALTEQLDQRDKEIIALRQEAAGLREMHEWVGNCLLAAPPSVQRLFPPAASTEARSSKEQPELPKDELVAHVADGKPDADVEAVVGLASRLAPSESHGRVEMLFKSLEAIHVRCPTLRRRRRAEGAL